MSDQAESPSFGSSGYKRYCPHIDFGSCGLCGRPSKADYDAMREAGQVAAELDRPKCSCIAADDNHSPACPLSK